MAKRAKSKVRKTPLPVRSVKAGRPPEERLLAPRVQRVRSILKELGEPAATKAIAR